MSKTMTYSGDKWPGNVTFSDPLTLPQAVAFEDAIKEASKLGEKISATKWNLLVLPGILTCVEKWELKNFPERPTLDTFPLKPHSERAKLIAWLVTNISDLYKDTEDIPNE